MTYSRHARRALVAVALICAAGPSLAVDPSQIVNQRPTINGGITKDEADLIRQQAQRYPLEITLARRGDTPGRNDFAAQGQIRVTDSAGHVVLDRADAGPIFLADLPAGAYTVEATFNGQTKSQRVQLNGGRHAAITFLWE
jgi:hypothetical protein